MVRSYTDKELLTLAAEAEGFKGYPSNYWIIGIRSKGDVFNEFDDKFYIFKGTNAFKVLTGTTNCGDRGLLGFFKYKAKGAATLKADYWHHKVWAYGLHRGKMEALRQVRPTAMYRDNNLDEQVDEIGTATNELVGINFHTTSHNRLTETLKRFINGHSLGCQVVNNPKEYYEYIGLFSGQPSVTYCLLKEK
jgi:hypothetical protein